MPFNLPLKDMSLQEKLAAMESLWEELARTPEAIESPAWHKDILDGPRVSTFMKAGKPALGPTS